VLENATVTVVKLIPVNPASWKSSRLSTTHHVPETR